MDNYYYESQCSVEELMEYIMNSQKCFENKFTALWSEKYKTVTLLIEYEKQKMMQVLS